MNSLPTERFSNRVADIGSGTGIFSRQLASRVAMLHCVEPNREMREHSVSYLRGFQNVDISEGSAEDTGLPAASVDAITAAQAIHWFDRERTKREFRRILRPGGRVALLWYERMTAGDPFLEGYEALLRKYSIDYRVVDHRNITGEMIREFFHPNAVGLIECPMSVEMNLGAIRGWITSSSYSPPPGHPNHTPLMDGVGGLFDRWQRDGTVAFRYRVFAHTGTFTADEATVNRPPARGE